MQQLPPYPTVIKFRSGKDRNRQWKNGKMHFELKGENLRVYEFAEDA